VTRDRLCRNPCAGASIIVCAVVACLALTVRAETLFFEAEGMRTDGVSWVLDDGGWQTGSASGEWMLWGSAGGQGSAGNTVTVNTTATYRVWIRYVDILLYRGPFRMQVFQDGVELGAGDFDLESLRATPEGAAEWGSAYGEWVWGYVDVPLTNGTAEIVVSKLDPVGVSWVTRRLDCIVVTTDLDYVPQISDFVPPLYVKVTMGPTHPTACVVHLWGRRPRGPSWYLPHYNMWENKVVPQCYTGIKEDTPPTNALTAGESSPWFDLAPLLDPVGDNRVRFYAMQEYNTGLPASDFTVYLSSTPSETGLLDTFSRAGQGSGVMLVVDLTDRSGTLSDLEYSTEARAVTTALGATPGRRPAKFPVVTSCAADSSFCRPATISNEISVLSSLGFSGLSVGGFQPTYYNAGFSNIEWRSSYFHLVTSNDYSQPRMDAIRTAVSNSVQDALDMGHADDIVSWWLMDEPGSESMAHIEGCSVCAERFREYLHKEGVTPAELGHADWSTVTPTATTNDAKTYAYTVLFRCRILTDMCRIGTSNIVSRIPDAPTSVNFAEESTFYGNLLSRGADWFDIFEQDALQMGWTEDWLPYTATYQMCGYRADLLRAACSRYGRPFRMYNILKLPWDSEAKPVAEIGHGARAIYHYTYGPYYVGGDAKSLNYELYPALREVNHAIGSVEDYLVDATVPPARIALLYSHSTDVWTLDQTYSVFGKDRMGIYLILRHLGYPLDFVTEKDITAGRLDNYAMLICDASNLHTDALAPLVSWLNAGGVLYIGAGSLMRDQFNTPLGFDAMAGLSRGAFVYDSNPGREYYELPVRPDLAPVDAGGETLESVCGYQSVVTNGTETVLATFSGDGTPAVFIRQVGAGKLEYAGFFPGLAYQKAGVLTMKARNEVYATNGTELVTYGSTDFPAAYRTLFTALLAPIAAAHAPPVVTGNYLVEANRLEGPAGTVITLSNWTGAPLPDLQISFARNGRQGDPFTAVNPIKQLSESAGVVTVTFDMAGPCDFIVLPQAARMRGTCITLAAAARPPLWTGW